MIPFGLLGGMAPAMASSGMGLQAPLKKPGFLQDPANRFGLLQAAAGLLSASGPSTTPINLGQAMGQGLQAFGTGRETYANNDMDRRYKEFLMTKEPKTGEIPSHIQNYQYWNSLDDKGKQNFMNIIRGTYAHAGERRGPSGEVVIDINTATDNQRQFKEGEAGGAQEGKQTAEAAFDLPQIEKEFETGIRYLEELANHPAMPNSVGIYSAAPVIPGTQRADFVSRLEQMQGQAFLAAFQKLKGGGQISVEEGRKATDAMNRLKRASSPAAFKVASKDFADVMRNILEAKRAQAKQAPSDDQFEGWTITEKK
jgi:hypothetical protein